VVSKNGLTLIRLDPIKFESYRQRPPQPPQARDGFLPASVAANLELPRSGDPDLDLIARLELQRFDNDSGQT
jgi:hypothetical protein